MYAIAMKVVTPPRTSVATVDPLSDMWKYRSSHDLPAGGREPAPASSAVFVGSTDCWVMVPSPKVHRGTRATALTVTGFGEWTTRGTARDERISWDFKDRERCGTQRGFLRAARRSV
ncbi:hypothetical protein GCM10010260_19500 [Streptomyces filipinensis]|uniref:Uncharacterized protein n=1 Tax=Streptomyces filipinensis TaxID=66887 RepID=A0A918I9Z3_9ACTN|nr:hypothetical protein GCM10010260_19500 [Streptomyces filipinensis]